VTLLPRLAIEGGVLTGAPVAVRPLAREVGRTLGLAWRARSPRAREFRDLAAAVAAAVGGPPTAASAPAPRA